MFFFISRRLGTSQRAEPLLSNKFYYTQTQRRLLKTGTAAFLGLITSIFFKTFSLYNVWFICYESHKNPKLKIAASLSYASVHQLSCGYWAVVLNNGQLGTLWSQKRSCPFTFWIQNVITSSIFFLFCHNYHGNFWVMSKNVLTFVFTRTGRIDGQVTQKLANKSISEFFTSDIGIGPTYWVLGWATPHKNKFQQFHERTGCADTWWIKLIK